MAIALWASTPAASAEPPDRELVRRGFELNFAGDFAAADVVWTELRAADPNHPAASVLPITTLFWRQMFDESDVRFDGAIELLSERAIELSTARLARDETDAMAHLYLGQALVHQARLEGVRDRFLSAGSRGEEARGHLERALELDPQLVDAKHPLGMYYYYASALPRVLKWFRWLWFVPSGDGPTGLRYVREVAASSAVYSLPAQFILSNIYANYESDGAEQALEIIARLQQRFPLNTLIHFEYVHQLLRAARYEEAIAQARELEMHPGTLPRHTSQRHMATIWRARAELRLQQPERAWNTLAAIDPADPALPNWGEAWVTLVRAHTLDALGERGAAIELYQHVLDQRGVKRSERARELALRGAEFPFDPARAPQLR